MITRQRVAALLLCACACGRGHSDTKQNRQTMLGGGAATESGGAVVGKVEATDTTVPLGAASSTAPTSDGSKLPALNCDVPFATSAVDVARPADGPAASVAVGDLVGDDELDVVVASGADITPGHVTVLAGPITSAVANGESRVAWQTQDARYNARVAIADLDKDGRLDLAVSIVEPIGAGIENADLRAAELYLTAGGPLPRIPTTTLTGYRGADLAFGDANGDGWLDLAVASLDPYQNTATPQFVYLNEQGTFSASAVWQPETSIQANSVRFHDLDQDGLLDLIYTAPTPQWGWVFSGVRSDTGAVGLSSEPRVMTRPQELGMVFTPDFDVARFTSTPDFVLAYSAHYCTAANCYAPLSVYDTETSDFVWTSRKQGMGAVVRAGELTGDDRNDLIGGFWAGDNRSPDPGPLLFYCGGQDGVATSGKQWSADTFLAERLVLADLDGEAMRERTFASDGPRAGTNASVVTLPERLVARVDSVSVGGKQLERNQFASVPGENWVALAQALDDGDSIEIRYQISSHNDLIIADLARSRSVPVFFHSESTVP